MELHLPIVVIISFQKWIKIFLSILIQRKTAEQPAENGDDSKKTQKEDGTAFFAEELNKIYGVFSNIF